MTDKPFMTFGMIADVARHMARRMTAKNEELTAILILIEHLAEATKRDIQRMGRPYSQTISNVQVARADPGSTVLVTFDESTSPHERAQILAQLRTSLTRDGYVPRVAEKDRRASLEIVSTDEPPIAVG